ncbi:hypothetical protein [Paenibacillus eucommiae]|uniref:Uncharacterized protein n=1 Tax=Paenibacillus eucommiae TaxID=1355755 RepID=A0ABS4J2C0_9BACL|nr:hypothetical protein [Paenibacillus eucommiae]MBP1993266.1 hypothetical protein [Paenibacillus eucommiae]
MSKDHFDLIFERLLEEAVQENYNQIQPMSSFAMKKSWEAIHRSIEEQGKAN